MQEQRRMPKKLRVTAIQRLCVNDGPGVRTVIFLKGCSLRCPWCCNPEAIHYNDDLFYDREKCLYPQQNRICRNCTLHGGELPKERCPLGAYERTYNDYTADELLYLILRDKTLFEHGGGVTFSGGEPLVYSQWILPILQELRKQKIHIAYESTLFSCRADYNAVCSLVDYWMVDLKFQYGYIQNQDYAIGISDFYENLKDLQQRKVEVKYRMVVMDGILDKMTDIINQLLSRNIRRIELLPCHSLADTKYRQLGIKVPKFSMPSNEQMKQMSELLRKNHIESTFLSL